MPAVAPAQPHVPLGAPPSLHRYVAALVVMVAGILVQYVITFPWALPVWQGELLSALLAYGPGLLAFFAFVGTQPLRNFTRGSFKGGTEVLRWYGVFGLLSLLLVVVLLTYFLSVEPHRATQLLGRSTGLENAARVDPWFFIGFSVLVGFAEETLSRGFVLGGALLLFGTKRWKLHAVWTSVLFAGVHVYYALTYAELSAVSYVPIFLIGLTLSFAYIRSGGNLLAVSLFHGGYDAIAFTGLLPGAGANVATALYYGLLVASAFIALALYLRERNSTAASGAAAQPSMVLFPVAPAQAYTGVAAPQVPPFAPPTVPAPEAPPQPPLPTPMGAAALPPSPYLGARPAPFLPPLCRRCGAIVVGDVQGLPLRCPRCGEGLSELSPAATAPGSPVVQAWVPSAARAPAPSYLAQGMPSPTGAAPYEDLPPGAWPPEGPKVAGAGLFHHPITPHP